MMNTINPVKILCFPLLPENYRL